MSEPDSGSDLASIRTRAERTADGWRVTGTKLWTTGAHHCEYMIALVRTGAGAQRHAGLSQFLIPLRSPGITIRPIRDLTGNEHFCEVVFDEAPIPADALVGAEGNGWAQVMAGWPTSAAARSATSPATRSSPSWCGPARPIPTRAHGPPSGGRSRRC